ncbi:MAG: hypothetical protein O4965_29290, partial [Trichodesmium sp. St19_bin1]|nr:hypothetical protein [Trichodesmium sp. St19_bin1]
ARCSHCYHDKHCPTMHDYCNVVPSFIVIGFRSSSQPTVTAVFMSVDHSRDALMQRPYKVLIMAM